MKGILVVSNVVVVKKRISTFFGLKQNYHPVLHHWNEIEYILVPDETCVYVPRVERLVVN